MWKEREKKKEKEKWKRDDSFLGGFLGDFVGACKRIKLLLRSQKESTVLNRKKI
jgi:hypothetical protein